MPPPIADHDHAGPGGSGFASGSVLDTALPSPALAAALDDTLSAGLTEMSDDALAGVILAARRCESRATAQMLAAVAELDRRRAADSDHRVAAFIETELALLLTTTKRAAGALLCFAAGQRARSIDISKWNGFTG
jgi:hypothetical protein